MHQQQDPLQYQKPLTYDDIVDEDLQIDESQLYEPMRVDELLEETEEWRRGWRATLEAEFDTYCRYVFHLIEERPYHWTIVQQAIASFLKDVDSGNIIRGIINVKPRFGKSVMIAMWISWWLLKRPRCKFLYLSGSDVLVHELSDMVQKIMGLQEVQLLWGVQVSTDSTRKDLWKTTNGGYIRAVSIAGQVIGFGAGQLGAQNFRGCIIIDDPNKPDAVGEKTVSLVSLLKVQGLYRHTIKNRVNDPKTPILVVQQRLADEDLSGFLLNGGSGEIWDHLRIPVKNEDAEEDLAKERYKSDWKNGRPYDFKMPPGFVWKAKHGPEVDEIERLDQDTYSAQSMQNPRLHGGVLFRTTWLGRFERFDIDNGVEGNVWYNGEKIPLIYLAVFADTAAKKGEENDYSVLQLWGVGFDGYLYLLDQYRDKLDAPELEEETTAFLKRYEDAHPRKYGWREVYIEDKSSGIGLIQQLELKWGARVVPVPRGTDKVSRALSALLPLKSGLVRIPADSTQHPWVPEFLTEYGAFSKNMTHAHDDQMDPLFDAIEYLGNSGGKSMVDVV
ncbi:MAG: phage terminase large subunit [Candidatus Pacearchaeota archaeon]|nr:phage terminase large subunit [Candidatus Pacearchaeota archaeon]